MVKNKQIYLKEVFKESVDGDGNVSETSNITTIKKVVEPDYVKLYLDDILLLLGLPKSTSDLLVLLLKRLDYNLEIILNSTIKKSMAKTLGVKYSTIDQSLYKLCKKGILIRKDFGVYMTNPNIFGRGSWTSIEEIRLNLSYTDKGRILNAEIKKKTNKIK